MPGAGVWTQHLPGPQVDIEIMGDTRQVDNMLRSLYTAFEDDNLGYDFLQDYVDPILRQTTEQRFASEGDAVSGPWAPLAPATVNMRGGRAHPINVRTGAMKQYLVDSDPDISVHSLGATMWSPGKTGSKKLQDKVRIAQEGGTTPTGRPVPARPVLGAGEQDLARIMVAMSMYLAKHVATGGAEVNFL
jgi:hypothetical protein